MYIPVRRHVHHGSTFCQVMETLYCVSMLKCMLLDLIRSRRSCVIGFHSDEKLSMLKITCNTSVPFPSVIRVCCKRSIPHIRVLPFRYRRRFDGERRPFFSVYCATVNLRSPALSSSNRLSHVQSRLGDFCIYASFRHCVL